MKKYLAAAALIIVLSGCQNTTPTVTSGGHTGATIKITRTQEEMAGITEVEDEDSAVGDGND
ncbi:lipoprotein [Candidatus Peregrinibacteria bacterium]|nr:lipoprotein [Candidatus Peregrinibacteria bacterium]